MSFFSIKNSDLLLEEVDSSDIRFCLKKRGSGDAMELTASSPQTKQTWVVCVKQQLDNQLDFLNG